MVATKELPSEASLKQQHHLIRSERREKIQGTGKGIITHEVLHWVTGYMKGLEADISFNQIGNSLARTVFYSEMDSKTISHVLAASSVEVEGYTPFGYGMDRLMIAYFSHKGGDGLDQGKAAAFNLLHGFGFDILQRGIEIMTYESLQKKVFSHNDIVAIFNQAKEELVLEEKLEYINWHLESKQVDETENEKNGYLDMTVFDTGLHEQSVTKVKNGLIENKSTVCGLCGGVNGEHSEDRHRAKKRKIPEPVND